MKQIQFQFLRKNNEKLFLLFAILAITLTNCTEVYDPKISIDEQFLVVEGTITNSSGPHRVKLSHSGSFGEGMTTDPVSGALVYIKDSSGNTTYLTEIESGSYYTPGDFSGKTGEFYTLFIETENGNTYQSSKQEIIEPVEVDSIYGEIGTEIFSFKSQTSGDIYQREVEGINVFIDVSGRRGKKPKVRFNSDLLMLYGYEQGDDMGAPIYYFCWYKRSITDFLEADMATDPGTPVEKRIRVAFIPIASNNMRFVGFPSHYGEDMIISYLPHRILINSIYTINQDAFNFHYDRNKQLNDEGSFFDPVSSQLSGNIKNIEDPHEVVLGFFEASSVKKSSVNLLSNPAQNSVKVDTLECLDHVPGHGCVPEEEPDWWDF